MERTRRHRHFLNLTLLLGTFFVFVAGEGIVRVLAPTKTPAELLAGSLEYFPSPFAGQIFPAERQEKLFKGRKLEISARGTRGQGFALPKPPGVTRVVVLGGSSVFDVNADAGSDWPALAERLLAERGRGDIEVINAGTPGHMSWNLLGRLAGEIWLWEPDFIVLYFGWNDLKYYRWLAPERPLVSGVKPPPLVRRGERTYVDNVFFYTRNALDAALNRSQLYTFLRTRLLVALHGKLGFEGEIPYSIAPDPRRALAAFAPAYSEYGPRQFALNYGALLDLARAIGAKPVAFSEARLLTPSNAETARPKIRNYYNGLEIEALLRAYAEQDASVARLAKARDVPLLSAPGLSGCDACFADQVHTTAEGSLRLARTLADFLTGAPAAPKRLAEKN